MKKGLVDKTQIINILGYIITGVFVLTMLSGIAGIVIVLFCEPTSIIGWGVKLALFGGLSFAIFKSLR